MAMWASSVDSFEALPAWSVANVRVAGLETSILSHVRAAQMALHLPLQCLRMKGVLKAMVGGEQRRKCESSSKL